MLDKVLYWSIYSLTACVLYSVIALIIFPADYDPAQVPSTVTIPAGDLRMCFTSTSVLEDDDAMEPDETFILEITDNDPDDPRIVVREPTTTVIIVDDDGEFSGHRGLNISNNPPKYCMSVSPEQGKLRKSVQIVCVSTPPPHVSQPNAEKIYVD